MAACVLVMGCGGGGGGGGPGGDDDPGDDGGPDDDGGPGASESSFPVGFAVASPMSNGGQGMGPAPAQAPRRDGVGRQVLALTNLGPGKSFAQKQEELAAILSGTTDDDCALVINNPRGYQAMVTCYGPSIVYENHPDYVMGDPQHPDGSGEMPSGDLGLWTDTEGDEPCATAKLGALIDNVGDKVDYGLYMAASMVCLMNVHGVEMPAEGSSQDVTDLLDDSIAANNVGFGVRLASVERLPDDSGAAVYRYSVGLDAIDHAPTGDRVIPVDTVLEHVFDPAAPGGYHGTVRGTLGTQQPSPVEAYKVVYERSDESLRYGLHLAGYAEDAQSIFDEAGDIDPGGDWNASMTQGVFDLDAETGSIGSVTFSWQAGRMDDHTRVFNVFVGQEDDTRAGCGFFGFGPRNDPDAGTLSDNSISTFICNWAGPSGDHAGLPGTAQKQCFQSEAGGAFELTESAIEYAPVNDCSTDDGEPDDADFGWKLYDDPDEDPYDQTPRDNNLIDLTSDPDFAVYTPPTPPAGF